jgi:hypothetical protein
MLHHQYKSLELKPFVEKLEIELYSTLEKLCTIAQKQATKLSELEVGQSTSQYISLCSKLLAEIDKQLQYRSQQLLPYINELSGKETDGHNCSTCSGGCKTPHSIILIELKKSLVEIKEILQRLQMAVLPLYSESIYPDAYRVLRNHMALIENNLAELLFFEESFLLVKISAAQTRIHAAS